MTQTPNERPPTGRRGDLDRDALLSMSGRELDDLFRLSSPGREPSGTSEGIFLLLPGSPFGRPIAKLLGLGWQGKEFDAEKGMMTNRVSPVGIRAVPARVRSENSRLDGKACYVLDYSRTSMIARNIRDEIREVAPGLYLGLVYWRGIRVGRFALRFPGRSRSTGRTREHRG